MIMRSSRMSSHRAACLEWLLPLPQVSAVIWRKTVCRRAPEMKITFKNYNRHPPHFPQARLDEVAATS